MYVFVVSVGEKMHLFDCEKDKSLCVCRILNKISFCTHPLFVHGHAVRVERICEINYILVYQVHIDIMLLLLFRMCCQYTYTGVISSSYSNGDGKDILPGCRVCALSFHFCCCRSCRACFSSAACTFTVALFLFYFTAH